MKTPEAKRASGVKHHTGEYPMDASKIVYVGLKASGKELGRQVVEEARRRFMDLEPAKEKPKSIRRRHTASITKRDIDTPKGW